MVSVLDQRRSRRMQISWPVSVWHPKAGRFINGRSVDVSRGGAMIELPLASPMREGQDLEVNFPRAPKLTRDKGASARIKGAKVVRIDRSAVFDNAALKVAVQFEGQGELLHSGPLEALA